VQPGCYTASQAKLQYNEKKAGREKLSAQWKGIGNALYATDFGDPVTGNASVAVCIYDDGGALVGEMIVDRAGELCDGKECWKQKGDKAYGYKDKNNTADGISKLEYPRWIDSSAKAKAAAKGKNNSTKSQLSLPTGTVAALTGGTSATMQLHTSYGFCVSADVVMTKDDGSQYKAQKK